MTSSNAAVSSPKNPDTTAGAEPFPPVELLLPHSHPMILVDRLLTAEDDSVTAEVRLRPDSPLVGPDGRVSALVSIEYMAQTIGLLTGYESFRRHLPVQVGYLLGARDLSLSTDHFSAGDTLTVEVTRIFGEDELGAFHCRVLKDGETAAEATLNVYRNKEHILPGRH